MGEERVYFGCVEKLGLDWRLLKTEYITGATKSLSNFLVQKGIKLNGNSSRQTKGWIEERNKFQEDLGRKIEEETQDKIVETYSVDIAEIRTRHFKIAKYIQAKALQTLRDKDFETASQAVRAIDTAVKEERGAAGMDNQNFGVNNGINNPLVFGTRYGEELKNMDYDQLIAVLQKMKELDETKIN